MKPRIRNVVATANLEQHVEIQKLVNFGWGIYDSAIYRGVCGYVKSPEMSGRVAVFASGKMISIGSKSVEESVQQLYNAKFYLMQARLISDATLQPKIQNIVATLTLNNSLKIGTLAKRLTGTSYNPNQFPGIILKTIKSICYLIFASGKIVITGGKSENEINQASFEIQEKISVVTGI